MYPPNRRRTNELAGNEEESEWLTCNKEDDEQAGDEDARLAGNKDNIKHAGDEQENAVSCGEYLSLRRTV